ncbi:MAG: transglutaminase family protein [Flavitalea sp.]
MPRFKIHHVTKYSYQNPVRDSANQVILYPINDQYQEVIKQRLFITGSPPVEIYRDYYGNEVGLFMRSDPHTELVIDSKIEVVTQPREMPGNTVSANDQWNYLPTLMKDIQYIDFFKVDRFSSLPEIRSVIDKYQSKEFTPLEVSLQLVEYIYNEFKYITGITSVETTLDEVWKLKAGVCQDFAHILTVMLRILGIPARYVSGYICPKKNGMRGEGATHAWVEAYIPFYGWLGLDPTNNCIANDMHIRLAVGRNFSDCSPVKGSYKGGSQHKLEVGVSVSYEDGNKHADNSIVLTPQPTPTANDEGNNSYRRYMEMIQQQQ